MRIGGKEIGRLGVQIGEVASSTAGDQDLPPHLRIALDHQDLPPALPCLDGAHQTRGAPADHDRVIRAIRHFLSLANHTTAVAPSLLLLRCRPPLLRSRLPCYSVESEIAHEPQGLDYHG